MLFGGNYHSTHDIFKNHTRVFEGKEFSLLNPSTTRFATDFLVMMRALCLKDALQGSGKLQEFIVLNLRKEELSAAMIKENKSFHKRHI